MDVVDLLGKLAAPVFGALGGWVGATLRIQTRLKELEGRYDALKGGFKLDLETHKDTVYDRLAQLKEKLHDVGEHLDNLRHSQTDYARDAKLAQFIMEQQERWESVQRTLGRLEGEIYRMKSFPPRSR